MKKSLRHLSILMLLAYASLALAFTNTHAQTDQPLALVMTADGPIMPPMLEYIKRGIQVAERRNAEVLIIQLNTPGGSVGTMWEIISEMRDSQVPVVVYVAPRNAMAGSAGAIVPVPLAIAPAATNVGELDGAALTVMFSTAVSVPPRPSETCTVQLLAPTFVEAGVPVSVPSVAMLSQVGPETLV